MLRSKSVARSGSIRRIASSPASADAAQAMQNQSLSRAPVTAPSVGLLRRRRANFKLD